MGPKRKLKVSADEQTKAKKPKIEQKERKEAKEEPIEESEDEMIEDEKPVKKQQKKYIRKPRPIDGDPNSNLLCKKFLSLFQELIKGNPDIKLEELEKIRCSGSKIYNWGCLSHTKCSDHFWKATVNMRVRGDGCPYCSTGRRKRECRCKIPTFKNTDGSYKLNKEHMKRCTHCLEEKEKNEFSVAKNSNDGYHSWCSVCTNKKSSFKNAVKSAMRRHFLDGKCCQDCGEQNDVVLEFDHINNDKAKDEKGKIRSMQSLSPYNLCLEIKKTEIVCIRCHRLRTYSRHAGKSVESNESAQKRELVQKLKLERKCCLHCPTQITEDTTQLFDCDHIDPKTKIDSVCNMIKKRKHTLKDVQDEIAKCQVLCCICHCKKTAKDRKWRKISDFSEEEIAEARRFLDQHFQKDAYGHYIHVNPVKIELLKIHDKPQNPRKHKSNKNLTALLAALSNQESVAKNV